MWYELRGTAGAVMQRCLEYQNEIFGTLFTQCYFYLTDFLAFKFRVPLFRPQESAQVIHYCDH
jgi:hypothetical protein